MEVLGPIKEDGCKYQKNCRSLYELISDEYFDGTVGKWGLNLSLADSNLCECGKPVPKCKIYNFLDKSKGSIDDLLKKYVENNWKIELPNFSK
ncbi:MAG: hypothetical protein JSW73_02810 [Candidatus Woesearchaeota archaeon]|nr:MAG: hypothetical protein JSW73_02810 [Candidatus Woesearchaeota archaeon]